MPSSVETSDSDSVLSETSVLSKTNWPKDWTMWTNFNGTVYYTSDGGKLITTDDVREDAIRELVVEMYHISSEWFEEIDPTDAEVVISDADEALLVEATPSGELASWSRGQTYDVDDTDDPNRDGKANNIPFEEAQLRRIWQIYQDLKAFNTPKGPSNLVPALAYHMGQVMYLLAMARDKNNYGLTEVEPEFWHLSEDEKTVSAWELATWDLFLAVILCGTHENYRVRLEAAMPKRIIRLPKFRNLVRTLLSEWADSNLIATVILAVNVAFLGIPGLAPLPRSASIVSSICALTSLITGLHHIWQHREKTDAEHEDVKEYLFFFKLFTNRGPKKSPPTTLDLTLTAALLAIPLASLQWAVVSVTLAISALRQRRGGPAGNAQREPDGGSTNAAAQGIPDAMAIPDRGFDRANTSARRALAPLQSHIRTACTSMSSFMVL
ncbi:hypothetical protein C8R45DRAFT_1213494 [Mycena sanguinolenta]|nr:hypothetical protein C8R45DRAFT_1213494 [Mycena sanguinolenta]